MLGILSVFKQGTQSAQQCGEEVREMQRSMLKHSAESLIRMLYDFHQKQTSKKPGSVHATYLVDGVSKFTNEPNVNGHQKDGEDMHMQSSPYMNSSMPQEENEEDRIPTRSIVLAREEDLEGEDGMRSVASICAEKAQAEDMC